MSPSAPVTEQPSAEPQQLLVRTAPDGYTALVEERSALLAEIERELPDEIVSPSEYSAVAKLEARLGEFLTKYEPLFDEPCNFAYRAWKSACRVRELFIDGPKALKAKAKRLRGIYETKEEEARRAREREIAEEERRKEVARRNAEAKLLEKQGQKDMAAAVRSEQVHAPAISLPSAVPSVKGAGVAPTRENWTWWIAGCTDVYGGRKDKDARKRAAKMAPREYLDLDDAAITAHVKNARSSARIPGIEVFKEKV